MADLSLDEFIRKGNIKVSLSNNQQQKGRGRLQPKVSLNKGNAGRQPGKLFDARSRLGPKTVVDARDTIIINKKKGVGDARNKIVQKQVQKGTFDARLLLQRQDRKLHGKLRRAPTNVAVTAGQPGFTEPITLQRTLSNPAAVANTQIRMTNNSLLITRPNQKPQVRWPGSAGVPFQVPNNPRSRPSEGSLADSIPIIQIRNDRFRQPGTQQSQPYGQPTPRHPDYPDYGSPLHPQPLHPSQPYGYRDYDDPLYNEASIAIPEIPKFSVSTMKTAETSGMRPNSYTRVPPGAATVSQGIKQQPVARTEIISNKPIPAGVKRKPVQDVSGPLRLGRGGGPGIDLGSADLASSKKLKTSTLPDVDIIDIDGDSEVISPLQGFRVMVTNLYTGVTQDDIIELFGAVGPLKKAKLLKPGSAEVVYVNKEDAVSAVHKYHSRELDGQPMYVKMTTPVAAVVKKAVGDNDPDITGEALRLYRKAAVSQPEPPVEIPTIHRALFKTGAPGPSKSVKFTVKI